LTAVQNNDDRNLRIVIGCDTFPPDINGAARFAERLAGGLARHGHDVHIITAAYDKNYGTFIENHDGSPMTVHRIKSYKLMQHETLRFVWPFTLKRKTDRILDALQPDAVHMQSHLIMGRYLSKSAKQRGIRLLATNHIMPENLIKYSVIIPTWLEKPMMKLAWKDAGHILKRANFITTPTRRAAELLEAAAGVKDVLAISCGIDASRFANATPTSNKVPRVLFLGRLDYEKHIHNLLKAVAKLPASLGVQVEIVGNGGERENLKALAAELGISGQVDFKGHITEEELPRAYERATVFAMPSIAELQSIATMEAMASGRPVIAANAMALPHLVHNGDNGYLFEPDDVDDFAAKLRLVLTADQAELDRLSENSLHLIQSHDIERTLKIFEDLYRGEHDDALEESDDNRPEYNIPIGLLPPALHDRVLSLREQAQVLRERSADLRERLEDATEDVRERIEERLDEVREEVIERAKAVDEKVRQSVKKVAKKATEVLKGDDD
jgi:glycosyltransferase involved in cell wall biosynthesis/ElaB/YqjD/DUF883 family membrane-anchored ribosome-binding protein